MQVHGQMALWGTLAQVFLSALRILWGQNGEKWDQWFPQPGPIRFFRSSVPRHGMVRYPNPRRIAGHPRRVHPAQEASEVGPHHCSGRPPPPIYRIRPRPSLPRCVWRGGGRRLCPSKKPPGQKEGTLELRMGDTHPGPSTHLICLPSRFPSSHRRQLASRCVALTRRRWTWTRAATWWWCATATGRPS